MCICICSFTRNPLQTTPFSQSSYAAHAHGRYARRPGNSAAVAVESWSSVGSICPNYGTGTP